VLENEKKKELHNIKKNNGKGKAYNTHIGFDTNPFG
jgi:hypothetical protein